MFQKGPRDIHTDADIMDFFFVLHVRLGSQRITWNEKRRRRNAKKVIRVQETLRNHGWESEGGGKACCYEVQREITITKRQRWNVIEKNTSGE